MARFARPIVSDLPHHAIQRGNRRETILLSNDDYQVYLDFLKIELAKAKSRIWAW